MPSTEITWEIDFELVVLDGLDDTVSCEWEGCSHEALWTWTHGCGEVWLYCDRHRDVFDDKNAKPAEQICNACGVSVPKPAPWERL